MAISILPSAVDVVKGTENNAQPRLLLPCLSHPALSHVALSSGVLSMLSRFVKRTNIFPHFFSHQQKHLLIFHKLKKKSWFS